MPKRKKSVLATNSGGINALPSAISLNNEEFNLTVEIIRDVEDIGQKDKRSFAQILDNDKIKSYNFTSDLIYPIVAGELEFQDIGSYLFSKITADGRTFMFLSLQKVGNTSDGNGISKDLQKFEHTFVITNIDMLERQTDESTFRISFVSLEWYKFNNYLNYSSEGDKPILEILQNVIRAGELDLLPNSETKQVRRSQFFITPTSFNLLDSIRYLLSIAIDPDNGFYFFVHDHIDNNYQIQSLKQIYSNLKSGVTDSIIKSQNIVILPSNSFLPTGPTGRQGMQELNELNINGADMNTELLKPFRFETYDYINREFNPVSINFNNLVGTLPDAQGKSFRNNLNPPLRALSDSVRFNYQREKDPINSFDYYFSLTKLFMWTKVIEFKLFGDIERKAGDIIQVIVPEADEFHEKLGGYWYILRVTHEFDKRTYNNFIQACRIDHKVVETDKRVEIQGGER